MDIGDNERWLILMLISFVYGFVMRHMITMPVKRSGGYTPVDDGRGDISKPPRSLRPTPPGAE